MLPQPIRYASLRLTTRGSHSLRQSRPTRLTSIGACHRGIGRMFSKALARSVYNDAPDAVAFVHQVEALVDVPQRRRSCIFEPYDCLSPALMRSPPTLPRSRGSLQSDRDWLTL